MTKVKVIFRKYKNGNIVAIFPYIIWSNSFSTCFDDEGHSACDYHHIIKQTKPATEDEYKYRARLLYNFYGYDLKVIKKYNHNQFLKSYYQSLKK